MRTFIRQGMGITIVACIWCPLWANAQNLVVNGGFDTDAAGWTATDVGIGAGYRSGKGNPGGFFALDASPSALTDPTLSKVVTGLTPGVSYAVSGDFQKLIDRGGGTPASLSFGVAIDGVFRYESPQSDFSWHSFGFTCVPASTSVTLSIAAQRNGTGVSYGIDNIVMQPTPSVSARFVAPDIAVTWPTNVLGFGLQSSTNIESGSWSSVTNSVAIVGSNYSVTLSIAQERRFFRLRK